MKRIKAVMPYVYPNQLNFKDKAFVAWIKNHGKWDKGWYPRILHWILFRWDILHTLYHSGKEARLVFVQPVSLYFDTGFSAITHEITPIIWDCWPRYYDKMERWLKRHKVRSAIFTSSQEMEEMKRRLPDLCVMHCPEAIDTSLYNGGKELKDRAIDLLEFGRGNDNVIPTETLMSTDINIVRTKKKGKPVFTNEELYTAMGDAKVVIALPRSITNPEEAEGVETLTQRYWENMLSRNVMIGHAPKELIDIIGYNPVIELAIDKDGNYTFKSQLMEILSHIGDYQELVNKNREVALELGDWKVRMKEVREFLSNHNYIL